MPSESCKELFECASHEELTVTNDKIHHILMGGDGLTVARLRSFHCWTQTHQENG